MIVSERQCIYNTFAQFIKKEIGARDLVWKAGAAQASKNLQEAFLILAQQDVFAGSHHHMLLQNTYICEKMYLEFSGISFSANQEVYIYVDFLVLSIIRMCIFFFTIL